MHLWRPKNRKNWYVRGVLIDGKRRVRALHKLFKLSFPVTDKLTAQRLLTKLRMKEIEERLLGIPAGNLTISVKDFYLEYSRFCDRNKKKSTVRADNYRLKMWLAFLNRNNIESLNRVSKLLLNQYVSGLQDRKNSSINRHISLIRASLRWAIRQGYLSENPLRDFSRLKESHQHTRPSEVDPEDMRKLLSVSDEKFRLFIQILYWTLARKSEILSLTWQDIDIKNRVFTIRETKVGRSRTIPISDNLLSVLSSYKRDKEVHIFNWESNYVTRKFQRLRDRLNLKIQGIHQFRHARASELLRAGANPRAVQELLGHKTSQTTMEKYARVSLDGIREALKSVSLSLPPLCQIVSNSVELCRINQTKETPLNLQSDQKLR
jgi:site-specific recombinase XerD